MVEYVAVVWVGNAGLGGGGGSQGFLVPLLQQFSLVVVKKNFRLITWRPGRDKPDHRFWGRYPRILHFGLYLDGIGCWCGLCTWD